MKTYRCPDHIVDMFHNEDTKFAGRKAVVDWLSSFIGSTVDGDVILIPDEQGNLVPFEKNRPIRH